MEYRKFGSTYILRIDRGEEILASITTLCNAEKIRLGSVSGIGAVGEVTLGVFNREKFAYESTTYTGDYEIASCSGTITTKEGGDVPPHPYGGRKCREGRVPRRTPEPRRCQPDR